VLHQRLSRNPSRRRERGIRRAFEEILDPGQGRLESRKSRFGPHLINLETGYSGSFALGTNTASGPIYTINALSIALPGDTTPIAVPGRDVDSAQNGKPFTLLVTAFVSGAEGTQFQSDTPDRTSRTISWNLGAAKKPGGLTDIAK
jgi:hypothetical protein